MWESKVFCVDSKCLYDDKGRLSVDVVVFVFDVLFFDFEIKFRERRNVLFVLMKDMSSVNFSRLYLWYVVLLIFVFICIVFYEYEYYV